MPLHLIKLCVGCDSVADLEDWIQQKLKEKKKRGQKPEHIHTTRMVPKRADELTAGGSLYWVIRGQITCRERILDIRPFTDKDGIGRCRVVLDGKMRAGRAAPALGLSGLALSRGQGRAARSVARRARRRQNARTDAARIARVGVALDRQIIDQPRLADLGGDQQPDRPVLTRRDGRERQRVARFQIIERKAGARDLGCGLPPAPFRSVRRCLMRAALALSTR